MDLVTRFDPVDDDRFPDRVGVELRDGSYKEVGVATALEKYFMVSEIIKLMLIPLSYFTVSFN